VVLVATGTAECDSSLPLATSTASQACDSAVPLPPVRPVNSMVLASTCQDCNAKEHSDGQILPPLCTRHLAQAIRVAPSRRALAQRPQTLLPRLCSPLLRALQLVLCQFIRKSAPNPLQCPLRRPCLNHHAVVLQSFLFIDEGLGLVIGLGSLRRRVSQYSLSTL
jgi:hypothetical protein